MNNFLFTSAERVRREAGLEENPHVPDTGIITHTQRAESEVVSMLLQRYSPAPHTLESYVGSNAEHVLAGIATDIAVGYVLLEEYEGQDIDMADKAWKRISSSRAMLRSIGNGEVRLFDARGNAFAQAEMAKTGVYGKGQAAQDPTFTKSQIF